MLDHKFIQQTNTHSSLILLCIGYLIEEQSCNNFKYSLRIVCQWCHHQLRVWPLAPSLFDASFWVVWLLSDIMVLQITWVTITRYNNCTVVFLNSQWASPRCEPSFSGFKFGRSTIEKICCRLNCFCFSDPEEWIKDDFNMTHLMTTLIWAIWQFEHVELCYTASPAKGLGTLTLLDEGILR